MTIREERDALNEIANLLPPGYIKSVPFSVEKDISFEYNGITIKMSALYLNSKLNCYMFDLSWSSTDKLYGIPIRCGLDMLQQFNTPLPNLYANNHSYPGLEITSWKQLDLIIIDESVLERG